MLLHFNHSLWSNQFDVAGIYNNFMKIVTLKQNTILDILQ